MVRLLVRISSHTASIQAFLGLPLLPETGGAVALPDICNPRTYPVSTGRGRTRVGDLPISIK